MNSAATATASSAPNNFLRPSASAKAQSRSAFFWRYADSGSSARPECMCSLCESRLYFAPNRNIVVDSYFPPARTVAVGKSGWFGESGYFWVSRQKPPRNA